MNMTETTAQWLGRVPWLEVAANLVNLLSIVLATRNSVHTWWTGIIGCALFSWLFCLNRLYADATLQLFFIGTSFLGWWQWLHCNGQPVERPLSRTRPRQFLWIIPVGIAATLLYGGMLHHFTNAYAPFVDSGVLTLSVIAQLLLMQRKLETWIVWFLVNSIAIPLYASRELWLTAAFYVLFWCNAPIGFIRWRRALSSREPAAQAAP
jgi:nicotinamide mononucleotide transporter